MAKKKLITSVRLKEVLLYDPQTGEFTWLVAPNGRITVGQRAGSPADHGDTRIKIDKRLYRAHRLAWLYMTGAWPGKQIDHRDTNPANNTWSNLREASNAQNCRNRGKHSNNKSGFKGVSWHRATGKWAAATRIDGESKHLGLFTTAEAAHEAYAAAVSVHHGEFARSA